MNTIIDYNFLKENGLIVYEVISGSRAYGTNRPNSDIDKRYIYVLPKEFLFGLRVNYQQQTNDSNNDIVGYEMGRALELLLQSSPNIIELFNMPEENILYKHPAFDMILEHKDKFISKVCRDSFGGYAVAQIKKARGLNKKIVNPVDKKRKSILDFCYVIDGYSSVPLQEFLDNSGYRHQKCGLVNVPHARDVYAMFYDHYSSKEGSRLGYRGIVNEDDTSNEVRLSSIPKGEKPVATIIYNKDGYTSYCKDYKEYWEWVEKRNDDRYNTNQEHGKGYDSKNMMHCIRLIRMAKEIAEQKKVIVRRPDADELMKIRNGEMGYDALIAEADANIAILDEIYAKSDLPKSVDRNFVNNLLINFRMRIYGLST